MAPLIKDNKPLPSLTFGGEFLPIKNLYQNVKKVLHVFKLLFPMPFTNAKLES